MSGWLKMFFLGTQFSIVALIVGLVSFWFWTSLDPIHIVHSSSPVKFTLKAGEPLLVQASVTRTKLCASFVNRFVYRLPSNALVWSSFSPGGAAGVGIKQPLLVKIDIPPLSAGDYVYRAYTHNDCFYRAVVTRASDVHFRVEE